MFEGDKNIHKTTSNHKECLNYVATHYWTRAQELYNDILPITSNAFLPVTWFISFKMVKFHIFMKNRLFISMFCWNVSSEHPKRDLAISGEMLLEHVQKKSIYVLTTYSSQE